MSINLQKGQKIDLTKGGTGLKHIMVGLGWDEAQQSSSGGGFLGLFKSKPQDIDCDASAILCNTNGKYMDLVYYRNLKLSDGSIVHQESCKISWHSNTLGTRNSPRCGHPLRPYRALAGEGRRHLCYLKPSSRMGQGRHGRKV